ncbi:hypothetical protein [Nocardia niwae]|uniref:hypothetical protein n=1 Tax=Nocardia niwae TaxID=626084 RepID=UPI0007A51A16|nr:hypothetical protein [Nocardia niwae]
MSAVRVTAALVVLHDAAGKSQYRYRGALLRRGEFAADDVERLLDMGMIEQADDEWVEPADAVVAGSSEDLGEQGEGAPCPGDQGAGAPGDGTGGAAPTRPRQTSPKDEWIAYAVSRGMSAEEAAGLSRAELAARLPEE